MVPDEGVREVEQLLVDVDLAGVHQEVEAGLEIVAEVEELADRFRVEGVDQGVASAPEEVASEGEAESIFYMRAFRGVWRLPRERNKKFADPGFTVTMPPEAFRITLKLSMRLQPFIKSTY